MVMSQAVLRQAFLDYFKKLDHHEVASSPVRPFAEETTLLFTNAGMNQFKPIFLDQQKPQFPRVANSQKCIRASGKHNDLDDVGHDTYHHTFFEMLGNWSFNDYGKAEAIEYAWTLLTKEWDLSPKQLYATVYRDDDEAEALWKKISGLPADRILRFDEKDNFWEMGDTGPCGPCSEIHIDLGREWDPSDRETFVNEPGGSNRFIELWNLVFIQYNRQSDRSLASLGKLHVDTGMGFERILAVINGVYDNYLTDAFTPIIDQAAQLTQADPKIRDNQIALRVVADHVRTLTVAGCDGVQPGNEGRGYVLRRILRRASRYVRKLGWNEPLLHRLVPVVDSMLGEAYPEIREHASEAARFILAEEEAFWRTLEQGESRFNDVVAKVRSAGQTQIPGDEAFKLYDTFGYPLDLTQVMASELGLTVDETGYEAALESQRQTARAASGISSTHETLDWQTIREHDDTAPTTFVGYDTTRVEKAKPLRWATRGNEVALVVDRTPFYAEGGGQTGDSGEIILKGKTFPVLDCQKQAGVFLHLLPAEAGKLLSQLGAKDTVSLAIDQSRRQRITQNHTATHLLHAALRQVLGSHVRQQGSFVGPDYLRFDFSNPGAVSAEDLRAIESQVNETIASAKGTVIAEMSMDDAMAKGALAFFDEKYGDTVRVVDVPGFSVELCGGCHVRNVSEIRLFHVVNETSVAQGVRRIEAVTGEGALAHFQGVESELDAVRKALKAPKNVDATKRVEQLQQQIKNLEKQLKDAQISAASGGGSGAQQVTGPDGSPIQVIAEFVNDEADKSAMQSLSDALRDGLGKRGMVILCYPSGKSHALIVNVTQDLTKVTPAGAWVKHLTSLADGRGGGKPNFAMGSVGDAEALQKAVETILESGTLTLP